MLAAQPDFSWHSLASSIAWSAMKPASPAALAAYPSTIFVAASQTLAPACHDEQVALDLLFASLDEDDLDLLAGPE
jgi:hypothetical protein